MNEKIKKAIKELADQIKPDMDSNDALKKTQAVLNLTHSLQVLKAISLTK